MNRLTLKYYFRLEQRSRYPAGNCQQFPLPGKHTDDGGLAEFWQVDRAAVADSGGTFRRSNHGRKLRQHQPGMKKKLVERVARLSLFQLFQAVCFIDCEFSDSRSFECDQMSAIAQLFSQIVRQ